MIEKKSLIIGLPRALVFYKYPVFWPKFFKELGCQVILSPKTNKQILEKGCQISETESCLSFKIYLGHVDYLVNEVKPDYIFAPRLVSLRKDHLSCPKFFSVPDLAKLVGPKQPLLEPTIDFNKTNLQQIAVSLAQQLGFSHGQAEQAYQLAVQMEVEYWQTKVRGFEQHMQQPGKKIALISHGYNLYDDYINLNIKKKLAKNNVVPLMIDSVPYEFQLTFTHWDFEAELLNQVKAIIGHKIDGAVQFSTFNCGCDSVIREFIADEFKAVKLPYLSLIIDEHTGEAGLETRLEAFFDTLQ